MVLTVITSVLLAVIIEVVFMLWMIRTYRKDRATKRRFGRGDFVANCIFGTCVIGTYAMIFASHTAFILGATLVGAVVWGVIKVFCYIWDRYVEH